MGNLKFFLSLERKMLEISICEKNLKSSIDREEFNKIETLRIDLGIEEATKVALDRCKFKKFNYLKHNPKKPNYYF